MWLPPEDPSQVSPGEAKVRRVLARCYRLTLATIIAWHTFDFLFSSIWMHGYIWSLNLPIDLDMADKSAGAIVTHQLNQVGPIERFVHAVLTVLAINALLFCCNFSSGRRSVWYLLRLSLSVGVTVGIVRCLQMKQRLYPAIHEGFYAYFITFIIGLTLTLRPEWKKKVESIKEEQTTTVPITQDLNNNDDAKKVN